MSAPVMVGRAPIAGAPIAAVSVIARLRRAGMRLGRCRRGVAALEFAIVIPLLLTMLFAIVAFGTTMNALNSMQSGAQVAARSMAVGAATFSGSSVTCGTGVAQTAGTAENYACRSLPSWGTYSVTATQNCATLDDNVTLTANTSTVAIGDVMGFLTGHVLTAKSVMRKEGQCP